MNGLALANRGTETTATAPIVCGRSTGVNTVVASGTTDTLTDSIYSNDDNYPDNENAENAVIKCKSDGQVTITCSTVPAAGGSPGMGMRLSVSQPYVVLGSAGHMRGRPWGGPPAPPVRGQPGGVADPGGWQNAVLPEGSAFAVQDSSGNTLFSGTAQCNANYVFFCSRSLVDGSSYSLTSDSGGTEGTLRQRHPCRSCPGGRRACAVLSRSERKAA